MRVVDSKNKVSLGGILWKTTLAMDDLPLLKKDYYLHITQADNGQNLPTESHQKETGFSIAAFGVQASGLSRCSGTYCSLYNTRKS
jgi:hypothetical protein